MSIKMICSDLDGTILTYNQKILSERLINYIRELHDRKIPFVPASGRQLISMLKLFEPVKDCCYFISCNGAAIYDCKQELVGKTVIDRDEAMKLAYSFWDETDGNGEVCISTADDCCHIMTRNKGMEDRLRYIGNTYKHISGIEQCTGDIIKISVFLADGSENYIDRFKDKWAKYNTAVAGPYWIDSTLANKGTGVEMLSNILGISLDEVVAFGDNYNDVSMLDVVKCPYIMSTATDELLDRYKNHTSSVEDTLGMILG